MRRHVNEWYRVAFILAVLLAVVLLNGCATVAATQDTPWGSGSPDTVPNAISCQFRGESFCHPKQFNI